MDVVMSTMIQVEAQIKILIAAIPMDMIVNLLVDVYTGVILPTSTEVIAIVNNMLTIPDFGMYFIFHFFACCSFGIYDYILYSNK